MHMPIIFFHLRFVVAGTHLSHHLLHHLEWAAALAHLRHHLLRHTHAHRHRAAAAAGLLRRTLALGLLPLVHFDLHSPSQVAGFSKTTP